MTPQQEAAAILNHYMAQLAQRCDAAWTDRNRADIERAALLLAQSGEEPADEIPPYRAAAPRQLDTRVTQVLEREPQPQDADPRYRQWQERRQERAAVGRMIERNNGRGR